MQRKSLRLIAMILIVFASLTAKANPIDMRTAREVAMKFVNANAKVPLRSAEELQLVTTYNISRGDAAFRIFNTPNGFVIVAADDCATPILGYSDEGRPFDLENVPIQLQGYLQGFVEQIEYGIENQLEADEKTAEQWALLRRTGRMKEDLSVDPFMEKMKGTKMVRLSSRKDRDGNAMQKRYETIDIDNLDPDEATKIVRPTLPKSRSNGAVEPLITALWDQGCYYNALCPADFNGDCGHTPTGCVATAMGMIMHYWGYPAQGTGTHSYTPDGYPEQTVNFGATTYDWDNMPDQLDANSTQAQIDAVSTLLWHCGVAVDMVYGAASSSALDGAIPQAFTSYFGYCNGAYFQSKGDDVEWLSQVKASLDRNRPLIYFATDVTGFGGHAFVCDGYDASNNLHFNWGWGGNGNGYFAMDALNVNGFQFNNDIHALFGIVPQSDFQLHYNIIDGGVEVTYERPDIYNYSIIPDTVIIPSSFTIDDVSYPVIAIGDSAFICCCNLKSVVLPNTIRSIGKRAFDSNWELSSVNLPNSLRTIKECAFIGAISLSEINLPDSIETLEPWCFALTALNEMTIPRSLTTIGDGLCAYADVETVHWYADSCGFQALGEGVTSLWAPLTIDFGANCKHLPAYVFFGNNCLSISMPDSLISIGGCSFMHSYCLKNVLLGNSVITIGDDAFNDCDSLETITIPEQVRDMGMASFAYCDVLTTVYFNATDCINANQAFNYDNNLTLVIIGDVVRNIPYMMFAECHGLTAVSISGSVERIEPLAFLNCSSLKTVTMLPSTPPILDTWGNGFFSTFDGVSEDMMIIVPCESFDAYYSDVSWSQFRDSFRGVNETEFQLSLMPNNTFEGTVDLYRACDSMAVFYANANHGYHFSHWSNGSVMNPDTINLIGDSTIVAYFEKNQYNVGGIAAKPVLLSNFEQPDSDTIWTFVNGDYPNQWYINNLEGIDNRALFISDDGGVTNHYTSILTGNYVDENRTCVFAYTPMYLNEGPLFYSFDWRCFGVAFMDYYDAGLLFDSLNLNADDWELDDWGLPSNMIKMGSTRTHEMDSIWHEEANELIIPSDGLYYLVFHWDDGSNWFGDIDNNPPVAIDNIVISSLDSGRGSFTGAETVDYLDTVTLTAVPNPGYRFVCWYDGDTNITKHVVATDNLSCVALFEIDPDNPPVLQSYELSQGWNWWAPAMETSVEAVQAALQGKVIQIQSQGGDADGYIYPGEMLKIETNETCMLSVTGLPTGTVTVSVAPGPNWFGFIGEEKTVAAAFANFTPAEGDKVISQDEGFAVFENGAWHGTLETLQPGKGYVFVSNATEPKTLVIGQ